MRLAIIIVANLLGGMAAGFALGRATRERAPVFVQFDPSRADTGIPHGHWLCASGPGGMLCQPMEER